MALEHHGEDKVHQHVGREPSGRNFNARTFLLSYREGCIFNYNGNAGAGVLNNDNLPHNPLINAGAIMTASLVRPRI